MPSEKTPEVIRDVIDRYTAGGSLKSIGRTHGRDKEWVANIVKGQGVRIRPAAEYSVCDIRHDAFANAVNDPDAAYWVGFLMADGCIATKPNGKTGQICVSLSETDGGHVVKFRDFLGSTNKITVNSNLNNKKPGTRPSHRVGISSQKLITDLAKYGVVPRKSKTARVIGLEDDPHFWRGVLDGDGSVGYVNRAKKYPPMIQLCGSLGLVTQFCEFAKRRVSSGATARKSQTIYATVLACCQAYDMIRLLYACCPVAASLDRKRIVAHDILENAKPRRRSVSSRGRLSQMTFEDIGLM